MKQENYSAPQLERLLQIKAADQGSLDMLSVSVFGRILRKGTFSIARKQHIHKQERFGILDDGRQLHMIINLWDCGEILLNLPRITIYSSSYSS